jgi:hypothetical protein
MFRSILVVAAMICGAAGTFNVAGQFARQQVTATARPGPQIAGCPVFPVDNAWNVPVDKLPVDVRSKDYIGNIGAEVGLHPDFASVPSIGIPINIIDATVRGVKVVIGYSDDSDLGNYPIPPNVRVEGGSAGDGDHHIILIDKDRCELMELWAVESQKDGTWKAGSGIKMDLTSNGLRQDGKGSADAAGLPILPGLVRYDEVAAGEILHALRFTAPKTQQAYVWPARHYASSIIDRRYPPMGTRFRLRADFDISSFSKADQVILIALKRYGMFLADNGGPWFISGETDPRWNDDDLHNLNKVKGSDFEAVDDSDWPYLLNSARVDPVVMR